MNHLPLTHRAVLKIAVPVMISNMTTPLIGAVDTAVIGRIPDPTYIGGVALGALVFTFLYWMLAFLRMGTSGLTAQALGADDKAEVAAGLGRALLIALVGGVGLIVFQWPIREAAFAVLEGSTRVEQLARDYYDVRIWSAPASLINFALLGWFIGLGRSDIGLVLQLVLNLTNMALAVLFVLGFGWDVRGVAFATTLAEYLSAAAGLVIAFSHMRKLDARWSLAQLLIPAQLRRVVVVNADIMIRTFTILVGYTFFMSQGAKLGDEMLAANAILMHFITISAYFLDGFAFTAESLVGRAIGAAHREGLNSAARLTTLWAAGVAVLVTAFLLVFGHALIDLMTVDATTRATARTYFLWAALGPLLGVWAFQLDGIFIGATRTRDMRMAMLAALAVYFLAWWVMRGFGNHGLWAVIYVHYVARAVALLYFYPRLVRAVPRVATT